MSKRCSFADSCPMMPDVIDVAGACKDSRGEICGPVAAYGMLEGDFEGLTDLDSQSPIVGSFRFDRVPAGMPPEEVREDWVGVEVPVRLPERLAEGELEVSPADAVLSLLSHGRLDATDWFVRAGITFAPFGPRWVFQADEGTFTESEPITSEGFYGARLSDEVRTVMDEAL